MTQGFTINANINNPVGSMQMFAGSTAPSGYLICDGTAVSRSTYAKLFAVIGVGFGVGDNSTTFNIPDMRGAAPAGVGTSSGYTANETVALGTKYDDQMQGHHHNLYGLINGTSLGQSLPTYGSDGTAVDTLVDILSPITDGTNGTPRTGTVTKGKTVGVNFIIKY
jgi:hypothetical protein